MFYQLSGFIRTLNFIFLVCNAILNFSGVYIHIIIEEYHILIQSIIFVKVKLLLFIPSNQLHTLQIIVKIFNLTNIQFRSTLGVITIAAERKEMTRQTKFTVYRSYSRILFLIGILRKRTVFQLE